MTNPNDNAT
jgi:hypothetical protein